MRQNNTEVVNRKGSLKGKKVSAEAVTMAILREVAEGRKILLGTTDGQWSYLFDGYRAIGTLAYYTQQCEFLGEQNPIKQTLESEDYDAEKPCYSFRSPSSGYIYQFNIAL